MEAKNKQMVEEVGNATKPIMDSIIDVGEEPLQSEPNSKKRKCTSKVWESYTKIMVNGLPRAKCMHCKESLSAKSSDGTSHLVKHLKKKHSNVFAPTKGQLLLQTGDVKIDGMSDLKILKFDQERSRKDLARMIILHEYPFSIVEHCGFREYSKNLQPLFRMVGRTTITNDCIKLFEDEKAKLYAVLDKLQCRVSLTSDMWTSNQNKGYFALTCHYIDDNWRLQKRILNFTVAKAPHTALAISAVILERLYKWNVDRKVMCLVLDNCSTNDAMVRDLKEKLIPNLLVDGEFFHVRCSARIINLIVQEAIDCIKHVISKVRESVRYVNASTLRLQQFHEVASQVRAPSKNLVLDVKTRWNSTYIMIETALEFKDAFTRLKKIDLNYTADPDEEEWANARVCCDNLKFFYEITNLFSSTLHPTSNHFFTHICEVHLQLIDMCADSIPFVCEMGKKMMVKFSKYWDTTFGILAVASVLDPRFKMVSVDFYMKEIYGEYASKSDDICTLLRALYSEYASKSSKTFYTPAHNDSTYASSASSVTPAYTKRREKFMKHMFTKCSSIEMKDELEVYLEEPVVTNLEGFDILEWWRHVGVRFPILQTMARDILCIPVSTVASESVFSTGGRVLDQYRSSMLPSTVEAVVCTQDWIRNELKEKNINITSINDFDNEGLQSSNVLDVEQNNQSSGSGVES